jgi:MYXO-CTERM domain-containing protein
MTDLLRRAAASIALLAILAPGSDRAFCRTTTTPIPANYSPSRGCFTEGLVLFWKGACVGYSLNMNASATIPLASATSVVDEAFNTWNAVSCPAGNVGITTSDLGPVECNEVRYNPNGPNQNVIVFRDDKWPYSDPNNTLGLTTVTFNADTGEIYDADMELNATAKNLSITSTVPANGFDLLSVVTHEAGHFLGLAHATSSSSTMYASYRPGTSTLRTLTPDDVAGICEIYPTATERTVDKSVSPTGTIAADPCDTTPRHGFGSTCAENPSSSGSSGGGCAVSASDDGTTAAPLLLAAFGLALSFRRKRAA